MKRSMVFPVLGFLTAAVLAGCDKPAPQAKPAKYDKSVDGSMPLPVLPSGRTILTGTGLPYAPPVQAAAMHPAAAASKAGAAAGAGEDGVKAITAGGPATGPAKPMASQSQPDFPGMMPSQAQTAGPADRTSQAAPPQGQPSVAPTQSKNKEYNAIESQIEIHQALPGMP